MYWPSGLQSAPRSLAPGVRVRLRVTPSFSRYVKHFAAGRHRQAFAVGGKPGSSYIISHVLLLGAGIDVFGVERDVNLPARRVCGSKW